jgi:hypothetical protein
MDQRHNKLKNADRIILGFVLNNSIIYGVDLTIIVLFHRVQIKIGSQSDLFTVHGQKFNIKTTDTITNN